MNIYVRRIYNHDITHEVSVTAKIVGEFFENKKSLNFKGMKSNYKGLVKINSATDPRFGGAFKTILEKEGGIDVDDLVIIYKEKEEYLVEIVNKSDKRYTTFFDLFVKNDRHLVICMDNQSDDLKENFDENDKIKIRENREVGGKNVIYYGIPGCGKSYKVDQYIKDEYTFDEEFDKESYEKNVFRTTFYLDYSNSDFIGQLVPKVSNQKVTYEPNFGPFTKALKRSYETDDMVYLVIEEINRGNAAAIFGDLFQLLDRLDKKKADKRNDGSQAGDSEYPITNTFLEDYLGIENGKVIIPSNLTIFATMNTSDQNVFPLDTAFKRRWNMEKVVDNYDDSTYKDYYIPQKYKGTPITWKKFLKAINKFIISGDEGFNLEDKQIGSYFITDDILMENESLYNENIAEQFNNKVLEYLWSDVAKFDRTRWINREKIKSDQMPFSFDELVKLVNQYGIKDTLAAFNDDNDGE